MSFGRCSTQHVTYLKLRRKYMLLFAEQIHNMTLISLKMVEVYILSEIVFSLSVAQHVPSVSLFSARDKSRDKWDNSGNSTQKMRTLVYSLYVVCNVIVSWLLYIFSSTLLVCLCFVSQILDYNFVCFLKKYNSP